MNDDAELIIWGIDYTPEIDCNDCGATLIADPNGNAPLGFTLAELIVAVRAHICEKVS